MPAGQIDAPDGWIQRGKELVGYVNIRPGQAVEEGGFAGIRVAYNGDQRKARAFALGAGAASAASGLFQILL